MLGLHCESPRREVVEPGMALLPPVRNRNVVKVEEMNRVF